MTRWIYSLLMWLAQPLLRHKLRRRGVQEAGYLEHIDERFGRYAAPARQNDTAPLVWIHAVSLGETRAAAVLIMALRAQSPEMRLLLTHGTATGRAEGAGLLLPGDQQCWQPWDTPGAVSRFLQHFKPTIGVLMETEVWPNLIAGCRQQGVPLVLANARLSEKSLRQAQRLAWLARPAYQGLTAVLAQTPADAARLTQLGAPVQGALGNLKFDATPNAALLAQGRQWRAALPKPVVMLAVSREGEELALLQYLKQNWPLAQTDNAREATTNVAIEVQWLIVPRHPQRFGAVATLIEGQGSALSRRSQWAKAGPDRTNAASAPCVWLGDSLGEMALYYGLADVALLGGSFEPLGGQNLIEAAACGCPIVMGPHTFNFADAAEQALTAGAAQRVQDLATGIQAAVLLARNSVDLSTHRLACDHFTQAHRGAAERLAHAILSHIKT